MTSLNAYLDYGAQNAKVHVLSRGLLKKSDYIALASMNSVAEATAYLKRETDYGEVLSGVNENNIHRGELEVLLFRAYINNFIKLAQFEKGENKKFLYYIYLKLEIDIIKNILRQVVNEHSRTENFFDLPQKFLKHMTIDVPKLCQASDIESFLQRLTGSRYESIIAPIITLKEHQNLFSIEMTLDMYYFRVIADLLKKLSGQDKKLMESVLGAEIDILNLLWIYRSKKYFKMKPEFIYSYIIPNKYKLTKEDIKAFVGAADEEEFLGLAGDTCYRDIFQEFTGDFSDHGFTKYLYRLYKKYVLKNPFSILATVSYLQFKNIEIGNITSVIEGIRYGLPPDEIMAYVAGIE